MDAAVHISEVSCSGAGFSILDGITIEFPRGLCSVILGLTGSGKSTLLKVAAGIRPPDRGRVLVLGTDLARANERDILELRRSNGFVFQDAALWSNLSAYQNISLPLLYHYPELSPQEVDARIKALVRELAFHEDLSLRPAMLSSGERKIVSFMRALILDPLLLFIDDPTSFVDSAAADRMIAVLKRLKGEKRTILITTNNPLLTSQLAEHLVVLKNGRVIARGPFKEVVRIRDRDVSTVLSDVLSESATYDEDILDLLGRPDAD